MGWVTGCKKGDGLNEELGSIIAKSLKERIKTGFFSKKIKLKSKLN